MPKENLTPIINTAWDEIFYHNVDDLNLTNHAFPLYLFTHRLYTTLRGKQCHHVLFMSREGQFLKKLFEQYLALNQIDDIKTYYFYGSRNSVMSASLQPLETESFNFLFRFFGFMSVKMFLTSIGFSHEQIDAVAATYGKGFTKIRLNFKKSKNFQRLKANTTFQQIYNANRTEQAQAFRAYLNSFGLDMQHDGLTFVDIGYHGTMQDLIFKFLGGQVKIDGYYIKNRTEPTPNNDKHGLLCDKVDRELFGGKINAFDAYNYEQILRADHGRCMGYTFNGTTAQPVLDNSLADVETYNTMVKKMQDAIFDKFNKIAQLAKSTDTNIATLCVIYYYYLVKNKTRADYQWIIDMQNNHHDDFGFVGYPGRIIAGGLRRFAFKIHDWFFVMKNRGYIKKLRQSL